MITVYIRFYEELNFFLRPWLRKKNNSKQCKSGTTVKAIIETFGIPHTEVDLILVNGRSIPFSYQVQDGDRFSVYPVFESFDISTISKVRSRPLRILRFILDVHLGNLVKQLRLLGFDTLYSNVYEDDEIAAIAKIEKRIILTRDIGLLKRKIVTHGYYVKAQDPATQLSEVVKRFDLVNAIKPFSRCLRCNTPLKKIKKEQITGKQNKLETKQSELSEKRSFQVDIYIPEKILLKYNSFYLCSTCHHVYWKGSHWKRMKETLGKIPGMEIY